MLKIAHDRRIPNWRESAARWWYVLKYHRKRQLAGRLLKIGRSHASPWLSRREAGSSKIGGWQLRGTPFGHVVDARLNARLTHGAIANAERIIQGAFRLLHQQHMLPDPVDWRLRDCPETPHLWRFHLHYQEYLLDLLAAHKKEGAGRWLKRAWALVVQWIDGNPASAPELRNDAWHPYCISRRIPTWVLLWAAAPPDPLTADRVLRSLAAQAAHLETHLEWDLGGNHLLENARALVFAAAFLASPRSNRWLQTAANVLRREVAEQVLPHGEHFERSPMYHCQMLELLLDIRDLTRDLAPTLAQACAERSVDMARFLGHILHPDGDIPLLGDACLGETAPPTHLIRRATDGTAIPHRSCHALETSDRIGDYWVFRDQGDYLILDAGPVGPDHLPAHAHADLLTIEASWHGQRLIIDSGVASYENDALRAYCRSSRAHNVLQIDDVDQCDMWSKFRMGYRGWPVTLTHGVTRGFHWVGASHNAYRRRNVPRTGRFLACRAGGPWLCADWAEGTGQHRLTTHLHIHPDVAVEKVSETVVQLRAAAGTLYLQHLTAGRIELARGWYGVGFGQAIPCPVVRWTADRQLPTACGWCLSWGTHEGTADLDQTGKRVLLRWKEQGEPVVFQRKIP